MALETAFSMDTSSIKYGAGVTEEVGHEMESLGAKRVMVVTDPGLVQSDPVTITLKSLKTAGIDSFLFGKSRVEPTDISFKEAIDVATEGSFDGYVAVGGGSSIDTAKAANLYATYPADFLFYVNEPIGKGAPVPGRLAPLIAIPTTIGTGSETTGVAIFDLVAMQAKTGIAHRRLRPTMGLVDPNNTRTLPGMVAACSGLDVLCHGLESFTALPYNQRKAPESPGLRPSYQGSNPVSDVWATKAIEMVARNIIRAVNDSSDHEARGQMLLAATFAGVGFGNAGCHLPHGMSYPVSGMVKDFKPGDYNTEHDIVPHGMSVALNAPAAFRFTAPASPGRHRLAARLLGAEMSGISDDEIGEVLAQAIIKLLRAIEMPNGLGAIGYQPKDVGALVEGAIPQHRVMKLSPLPVGRAELHRLFLESMVLWDK